MKAKCIQETPGRTPLVEISKKLNAGAATVFAKVESFGPGKNIVVLLPDAGERYLLTRLFE